jgi:hypothetical protein
MTKKDQNQKRIQGLTPTRDPLQDLISRFKIIILL